MTIDHRSWNNSLRDNLAKIRVTQWAFGFARNMAMPDGLRDYTAWIGQDPVTARQLERTA